MPRGGTTIPKGDSIQIVGLPPTDDTIMVSQSSFPGHPESTNMPMGSSADNPVTLSDVPTDASTLGACTLKTRASKMKPKYSVITVMPWMRWHSA